MFAIVNDCDVLPPGDTDAKVRLVGAPSVGVCAGVGLTPVPASGMVIELPSPVPALVVRVSVAETDAAEVGKKPTVMVAVCPGFVSVKLVGGNTWNSELPLMAALKI